MNTFAPNGAFDREGQHPAELLMRQIALNTDLERRHSDGVTVDPVPTARQVAAVLRSLATYGQVEHLLSPDVAALGADEYVLDPQVTGVGRYLAGLADHLRWANVENETDPHA